MPDGYHSVASVYLAVSLYEEVAATSTETPGITVSLSPGSTLDLDAVDIPLDVNQPCLQGRQPSWLTFPSTPQGSTWRSPSAFPWPVAWAAARRMPLPRCWRAMHCGTAAFPREELAHLAAELGADVPFSLLGGTAVGLGVGDQLSPALAKAQTHWVLVTADFGLSTPDVYPAP